MSFPENSATVQFQTDTASMAFCFQTGANLPCAFLAGNAAPECWNMGENFRFVQVYIQETGDLLADTKRAYTELLARVRGSTHAHLIRIWNYFAEINHGDEDAERYRQFCVGRAQAVDLTFNNPPPAATAIGYRGENTGLQVIALCSNSPAIALENARQTPAWQYPRQYGKVSPGFSRGAVLFAETESPILLASGTASIVGHASVHLDDVAEQCRESLRNLRALLDEGEKQCGAKFNLHDCHALRVYVREPTQLPIIQAEFEQSGIPVKNIVYVNGDVCRRELAVEIEGVFPGAIM